MRIDLPARSHMVAVRPARPEDLPALLRLRAEQAADEAAARRAYGGGRGDELELREALFETPVRAWAWLAEAGGAWVGYACATAGFAMLERAYYLRLEDLYVREGAGDAELRLVGEAVAAAGRMGCANVQWQFPPDSALAARIALYTGAARVEAVQYVLPAAG